MNSQENYSPLNYRDHGSTTTADLAECFVTPVTEAVKHDANKTDWSLMPWEAVEGINAVLEFGARKYNEAGTQGPAHWNWAKGTGLGRRRVLSAVFRHLFAYARGEHRDPESGLSHLNHAACGLLFMIYYNTYPDKYPDAE